MRRNAIAVLMAIEIMLNAANVNLVAFWRYGPERPDAGPLSGVILAIMVLTVAASEVAVGIGLDLALLPPLARRRRRPIRQHVG